MNALLLLSWLLPMALVPLTLRTGGRWWLLLAPLPALATAVLLPVGTLIEVPWLLLGMHLGMDSIGRLFLLFSALLWWFAGLYAALSERDSGYGVLFRVFFLLSMSGNHLLILAADMVSFYLGFALMGISAYGMLVQRRSQHARRAARVYLGWTLVGEVALFSAVLWLAAGAESLRFADLPSRELPDVAVILLLFGFGIKLALPGLHVWLPLTYRAAPAVAAAVLSGPMIKAGLLGWLRFLPPGSPGLVAWGEWLFILGAIGVALGVLVGITQRDPRAVLGYSSIAKMGFITVLFGTLLTRPESAPLISAALVMFALHHLLVKGALFLGMGEWERAGPRPWLLLGLVVPVLAMVGAPFTAGAAAKAMINTALGVGGDDLKWLFLVSAMGTFLLMGRFLWLVTRERPRVFADFSGTSLAWLILAFMTLCLPFSPAEMSLSGSSWLPLSLALPAVTLVWWMARGHERPGRGIPAGDILYLISQPRLRRMLHAGAGVAVRHHRPGGDP